MRAITDFTEENGATRLLPGSHHADHAPDPLATHDTVAAEMPAGSVLVWVGSPWHGGGANRTDRRRVGIAMNYCPGFIRQQENQQLGLSVDLVRRFPRRLQELVGYSVYHGLLGHIDKRHPAEVVLGVDAAAVRLGGSSECRHPHLRPPGLPDLPRSRVHGTNSLAAATGARKNSERASATSARTGAPDSTTSTMVSDVWVWPRATMWRTSVPAAANAAP